MGCAWNISGTISTSPPKLMAAAIRMAMRVTFFSIFSCLIMSAPSRGHGGGDGNGGRREVALACLVPGLPAVPQHDQHAGEEHRSSGETRGIERPGLFHRFHEGVGA